MSLRPHGPATQLISVSGHQELDETEAHPTWPDTLPLPAFRPLGWLTKAVEELPGQGRRGPLIRILRTAACLPTHYLHNLSVTLKKKSSPPLTIGGTNG